MDALAAHFVAELARGNADPAALHSVGEPDPAAAAAAFLSAARDPDLAPACALWAPALLRTARPGFGAQCLAELAPLARERAGERLDISRCPALPRVLGSSSFLARLLLRHPAWIRQLAGPLPDAPPALAIDPDWDAIRAAKYTGLLRIAARDLLARPFVEGLRELSDLADRCLVAALACAARETEVEAPALLALGKLGGRELNFSSDVDLLFVYDPPAAADPLEHNHAVARLIRRLKTALEARSEDGFGYRVDLGLRPEADTGVLANPVDVAIGYYEGFGAEWERQMLIRLRPVAGPRDVGAGFAREIAPFVYRRLIDPGVMRSVREMKARIEDERRSAGRDLDLDLKEGPGGIRDVEFLVQSLQLFFGGRDLALRTGNVLEALAALARLEHLPQATAAALAAAYTWLRRAEHALQLAEEQQTARFPNERPGQIALARRMGYPEREAEAARTGLLEDWTAARGEVRSHFEALVLRSGE